MNKEAPLHLSPKGRVEKLLTSTFVNQYSSFNLISNIEQGIINNEVTL